MSTFRQRSTCHLYKLQVLKPGLWPWSPSLPFRNDPCIQKCALRLQAVELLKCSQRNTKHMLCSWLTYHPEWQTATLWRALVFWSGDPCHAGPTEGKAWGWDVSDWVLGLTWPPRVCGHRRVPFFPTPPLPHLTGDYMCCKVWTQLNPPVLRWFTIAWDNENLLQSTLRASLAFSWFLDALENILLFTKSHFVVFFT